MDVIAGDSRAVGFPCADDFDVASSASPGAPALAGTDAPPDSSLNTKSPT